MHSSAVGEDRLVSRQFAGAVGQVLRGDANRTRNRLVHHRIDARSDDIDDHSLSSIDHGLGFFSRDPQVAVRSTRHRTNIRSGVFELADQCLESSLLWHSDPALVLGSTDELLRNRLTPRKRMRAGDEAADQRVEAMIIAFELHPDIAMR